jgi:hypothetical protein
MTKERSWGEHAKLAKHHKALGQTEIWLSQSGKNPPAPPWHLVTDVEPGGSHRLEMCTSVWFRARDPKSGLTFRWNEDIEDRDANGLGHYKINTKKIQEIVRALPLDARRQFQHYLADSARTVQAKADEWAQITARQRDDAATLALLATERP